MSLFCTLTLYQKLLKSLGAARFIIKTVSWGLLGPVMCESGHLQSESESGSESRHLLETLTTVSFWLSSWRYPKIRLTLFFVRHSSKVNTPTDVKNYPLFYVENMTNSVYVENLHNFNIFFWECTDISTVL